MNSIPITERAALAKDLDLDLDSLPIDRALGLSWCAETDTFRFVLAIKDQPLTRRGIQSVVSSVFDPLGFLAPVMLNAKLLLQDLCRLQLGWDDPVPPKFAEQWRMILCDIQKVSEFKVNRCFKFPGFGDIKHTELHHFSDASESGYGIVSYLRMTNTEDKVQCSFVIGKSRVAPLKKVTVPRLELTAATVAVRTNKMLKDELEMKIDRSVFWTDSMSVLRYVRNTTSRFHTFVANRLMIIHEGSNVSDWRYINTKLNPADIASRGLPVENSLWGERWIEAPKFLEMTEENWPSLRENNFKLRDDDPEVKKVKANLTCVKSEDNSELENAGTEKLINYYSSWYKLRKGVAWILKYRNELRKRVHQQGQNGVVEPEESARLSVDDLLEAEKAIVMYTQRTVFKEEIELLKKGHHVSRKSSIRKLDPYLDGGLLRVEGRLHESSLPAESKHPIILPKGHRLSTLILQNIHHNLKHSGRNHMLSVLRQNYWLINAPSAIRSIISKCVVCRRQKSQVGEQKMSNLPKDRVKPDEPPFTRVGVDYFGPFEVKLRRSRVKRYGVIFTCLASRAVHIEVTYSLDTSSYINALHRFIARRGQVSKMRSDNGTNLIGAERELRKTISEWNVAQIHEEMLQRGIDWHFNPPAGSHHGGVWERLIRSVRSAMNSTLKEQILDDEGLQTLMCEIETVLNGRSITRISDQFGDLEALTPNHLLTLKRLPNLPPGFFEKSDNYSLRRWRQVQYMAELFWKRWSKEYLPLLQERQRLHDVKRNLKTGDIVLIVDASAPRNSWPMGIVKETITDKNGLVRQVMVKTATNVLVRPVDKLCVLLEMDE